MLTGTARDSLVRWSGAPSRIRASLAHVREWRISQPRSKRRDLGGGGVPGICSGPCRLFVGLDQVGLGPRTGWAGPALEGVIADGVLVRRPRPPRVDGAALRALSGNSGHC